MENYKPKTDMIIEHRLTALETNCFKCPELFETIKEQLDRIETNQHEHAIYHAKKNGAANAIKVIAGGAISGLGAAFGFYRAVNWGK